MRTQGYEDLVVLEDAVLGEVGREDSHQPVLVELRLLLVQVEQHREQEPVLHVEYHLESVQGLGLRVAPIRERPAP